MNMNTSRNIKLCAAIFILVVTTLVISCKKEIETKLEYPRVETYDVQQIDSTGATFRAEVFSVGNLPIIDYGFVWGVWERGLNINNDIDKVFLGAYSGIGTYEARIPIALEKEKEYYVKAFVKTNDHTVYGQSVSFVSMGCIPPIIKGFDPQAANWGDTIRFLGENFWNSSSIKVFFGDALARKAEFNSADSTIWAVVPKELGDTKCIMSVEIGGNFSSFVKDSFNLIPPAEIYGFEPLVATWGDTVTIQGYFVSDEVHNVFFSDNEAKVIELSENFIRVIVPNEVRNKSTIYDKVNNYICTANDSFIIQPPEITSISTSASPSYSKVVIKGKGFSRWYTEVFFGEIKARIVDHSYVNTIIVEVPSMENSNVKIRVKVYGLETEAEGLFQITNPEIHDFYPKEVTFGDEITIVGKNFNNGWGGNIYILGSSFGFSNSSVSEVIKFPVSDAANNESKVEVSVFHNNGAFSASSEENIILKKPIITNISKTSGLPEGELIIYGDFFKPESEYFQSQVYFGDTRAEILSSTRNEIKVTIPNLPRGEYVVSYHMCGYQVVADQKYRCISPWRKIESIGLDYSYNPFTFVHNEEVYVAGPNGNMIEIFKFDQSNYQWSKYKSFTMGDYAIVQQAIFYMKGKLYILGGRKGGSYPNHDDYNNHLHSFNLETNEYKRLADFPLQNVYNANTLQIDEDRIIVYTSYQYDCVINKKWVYSISSNHWEEKGDFLLNKSFPGYSVYINSRPLVFDTSQSQYMTTYPVEYFKEQDSWSQLAHLSDELTYSRTIFFSIDDAVYLSTYDVYGINKHFWQYNINSNKWAEMAKLPVSESRDYPVSFSVGGKGYFGFGYNFGTRLTDFYEYDPTLEP